MRAQGLTAAWMHSMSLLNEEKYTGKKKLLRKLECVSHVIVIDELALLWSVYTIHGNKQKMTRGKTGNMPYQVWDVYVGITSLALVSCDLYCIMRKLTNISKQVFIKQQQQQQHKTNSLRTS